MAVFLTKNAPGLRTSPVKRGYWVVRRLLGEHIPRAAAERPGAAERRGEARRPDAARDAGAAPREPALRRLPRAVRLVRPGLRRLRPGRRDARRGPRRHGRSRPAPRSPTAARAPGSTACARSCAHERQDDFVDNLCRKLLAYALGRSLLPSDEPLARRDAQASGGRAAIASAAWSRRSSPARSS